MAWLISLLAVITGSLNTVQAGANATLSKGLGQPVLAALIVSGVNAVAYLFAAIFVGLGWPSFDKFTALPWWAWIGGLLGGTYVLTMVFFAERLGSAVFTGLTVTAGLVTSVALDHYGLIGFKEHPMGAWRLVGCIMMVSGVALISAF